MAKKGFGTGMVSNISDAARATQDVLKDAFAENGYSYAYVSLRSIDCNERNDYANSDTEEEIRNLAEDIRRQGLLHNIVLSKKANGRFLILSGERRYRAFRYLFETDEDVKWAKIYSKVLDGLTDVQEMLILDAANLQARGGIGNEQRFREATARFIRNLQESGALTQEQAIQMGSAFINTEAETIRRNVSIENDLLPEIRELLNGGMIPKAAAGEYARLPEEMQKLIAENLLAAKDSGAAALQNENRRLENLVHEQKRTIDELETKERRLGELSEESRVVDEEIRKLNDLLQTGADPDEIDMQLVECEEKRRRLTMQKDSYTAAIHNARAVIRSNALKLEGAQKKPTTPTNSAAEALNRSVTKAETAINAVTSRNNAAKFRRLDPVGRKVMLERVQEMRRQLEQLAQQLSEEGVEAK